MQKFQNVSPVGALDIPALNRVVEADEVFEVPDELVEYFKSQPGNFAKPGRRKKSDKEEPIDGDEESPEETIDGDEESPEETSSDEQEEESR